VKIVPLTKELLDSLDGRDRFWALRNYRRWVDKVRLQDRKVERFFQNKIYRTKNRESINAYRRKWYFENRGRVSEYHRRYRENKGRGVVL